MVDEERERTDLSLMRRALAEAMHTFDTDGQTFVARPIAGKYLTGPVQRLTHQEWISPCMYKDLYADLHSTLACKTRGVAPEVERMVTIFK